MEAVDGETFEIMIDVHELLEEGERGEARELARENDLRMPGRRHGHRGHMGPEAREALMNGDYGSFLEAMEDRPWSEEIDEDDFELMVRIHELKSGGNHEEAREMMEDNDLWPGRGRGGKGRGKKEREDGTQQARAQGGGAHGQHLTTECTRWTRNKAPARDGGAPEGYSRPPRAITAPSYLKDARGQRPTWCSQRERTMTHVPGRGQWPIWRSQSELAMAKLVPSRGLGAGRTGPAR